MQKVIFMDKKDKKSGGVRPNAGKKSDFFEPTTHKFINIPVTKVNETMEVIQRHLDKYRKPERRKYDI